MMNFKEAKHLLVVYKEEDEEIFEHLKGLVEKDDDLDNGQIIGTEDGTIKITKCSEKAWMKHKEDGNEDMLADKYIFIDNIKGVLQSKYMFSEHGVSYGLLDENHLRIYVNMKYEWKDGEYESFIQELKDDLEILYGEKDVISGKEKRKKEKKKYVALSICGLLFPPVNIYSTITLAIKSSEDKKDDALLRKQMLLYGICKLYYADLDAFVKA